MALDRAVVGALSHAELVDLVVRQSELIDELRATIAQQQALIARLEARIRELEAERDRNDPTKKMPGLKPAATPRHRKDGPRKRRAHGFSRRATTPTEQVVHAVSVCPACQTPLAGGSGWAWSCWPTSRCCGRNPPVRARRRRAATAAPHARSPARLPG